MTRVLIIGSSHVGALKRAAPEFAERHPGLDLEFFGVRGPCYLGGRFKDGVFNPAYGREKDRELALATNGALTVDATGYDAVLMVGHRFGFPGVLAMLENLDILEGGRSARQGLVPQTLVDEVIAHITSADGDALRAATEGFGPVTVALAPFPSPGISAFAGRQDLGRMVTAFWQHPEAQQVYDLWREEVTHRVTTLGHDMLWQPAETISGPYQTREEFALNAADHNAGEMPGADHRHMNAAYGLKLLEEYATRLQGAHVGTMRRAEA